MTFLQPDDHMIVMNLPSFTFSRHGRTNSMTDDELKRLRDVGVRTVMLYDYWSKWVVKDYYIHHMIKQARRAGLRIILSAGNETPVGFPLSWYSTDSNGFLGKDWLGHPTLSIWNMKARDAILKYFQGIIDRYGEDDLTVINAIVDSGECVSPRNHACLYDPAALASHEAEVGGRPDPLRGHTLDWLKRSVVQHYMAIDELLMQQHGEIWNALHRVLIRSNAANGNVAQPYILEAEQKRWPDAERYLLQYTYWNHSKNGHKAILDGWIAKYGLKMIVEADHCSGLPKTAPLSIAAGFRGQIVGPVHPCAQTLRLEQEHVDVIAAAIKLWGGAD